MPGLGGWGELQVLGDQRVLSMLLRWRAGLRETLRVCFHGPEGREHHCFPEGSGPDGNERRKGDNSEDDDGMGATGPALWGWDFRRELGGG